MKTNVLYYGDNLEVMHRHIEDNSIDLIYIDPPFFSSKAYEIIYGDTKEKRMFEDRWKGGIHHYINWMESRLALMREKLKATGSIYVHLDWHAVHYIKVSMDRIFGDDNFLNEVIWHYRRWTGEARHFLRMHDNILFYAKDSKQHKFNMPYTPYTEKSLERKQHYHTRIKGDDIYVTSISPKGVKENDVWMIPVINSQAKERLGYPTQKPELLLKRIIEASSDRNDIVADFFCGCGTTVAVAQQLGRAWIGCDVSRTALRVVKDRLVKCGATHIEEIGVPKSIDDLKAMQHFEFQNYIISYIQGINNPKLVGDVGIDGWTVFKRHPIQVKQSEHVGRPEIQKFESAIRAEKKDKGYVFAFSFSKPAYEEVARCKQEDKIEIELWPVLDLMNADPVPSIL
jgi:DNA modification methylase